MKLKIVAGAHFVSVYLENAENHPPEDRNEIRQETNQVPANQKSFDKILPADCGEAAAHQNRCEKARREIIKTLDAGRSSRGFWPLSYRKSRSEGRTRTSQPLYASGGRCALGAGHR